MKVWILDVIPQEGLLMGDTNGTLFLLRWEEAVNGIPSEVLNHHHPVQQCHMEGGLPVPSHITVLHHVKGTVMQEAQQFLIRTADFGPRLTLAPTYREYVVTATYFKQQQQWVYWGYSRW